MPSGITIAVTCAFVFDAIVFVCIDDAICCNFICKIIINNNIKVCLQAYYKDPCPRDKDNVPPSILLVLRVVGRAFLKEHSNAGTFVDQHIAAGAFSRRLAQIYENYFGDDK